MLKYDIIYSDGYWQLHDGTKIDNGNLFPLLVHEDRNMLIAKTVTIIMDRKCILHIHGRYGAVETMILFPIENNFKSEE